jgi:YD/RHS repeat protein (fragment)
MSVSTAQTAPVVSPSGGLAQNALAGVNAVFSSAVVYVTNIVPNGKTVKQEFSELVTGLSSGDWETRVRAVLKYGRGQTANVAVMGIGAVSTYAKGGLSALGTFGAVLGGGLIGGFAGAYVGTWGGDWLAENVFHWNKTDINSDKPVCKGDIISHQRKDMALWGLALGVLAGAAILFFGAMTFGFGLLAGFVAGAIIAGAHAMSQYGEEKGEIKEGSPDVTFEGRPVARMGDRVECDDHSPEEFIAEGVKTVTVNGRLLAKVGCRTTCDGNLDRKTETTIGVDKATATDPENYPIRESTSLLAEFAATASIYFPWDKLFGKIKGRFFETNKVDTSVINKESLSKDVPESVSRQDNNFSSQQNHKGKPKAYINENGDLVPPNPDGKGSIQSHIRGGQSEDSPYISTTDSSVSSSPKDYGDNKITIDTQRLQRDIDSGKVKDVEIITNKEVQEHLQNKVEEAQTRYNNNPSFKNESKLKRAQMDLDNATRDGEVLIKGIVPKEYITVVNN